MTRVCLNPATNFYATADELAEWLRESYHQYQFYYAFAKAAKRLVLTVNVDWDTPEKVVHTLRRHTDLYLGIEPLNLDVKHVNQIASVNPDSLWIFLPQLTRHGLDWGIFGTGTRNPHALRLWRRIAVALEDRTMAGAWYAVPGSQAIYDPHVRYTSGAAALGRQGVNLLGGGETQIVRLGSNEGIPSHELPDESS